MSYPTVQGRAVEGTPFREPRVCLGTKWAASYYLFFLAGTSTPANVYQDGALTTPFAPTGKVVSDSFGRFAAIYLDPSTIYRVQFFNSLNVQQWQQDPYYSQLATVGTSALSAFGVNIAPSGEVTVPAPNTGGNGSSLTINAGSIGSAALRISSTLPGNSALIVNSSATTGAQTATFAAANKPGTTSSAPAGWLPITCDGVQYYAPLWFDNSNFAPYTSSPSAQGEVILAATVTFGGSGVTTGTNVGTINPSNWFVPAQANVGSGYYINITKTGGLSGNVFSVSNIVALATTVAPSGSAYTGGTLSANFTGSTSSTYAIIFADGVVALGCTFTNGSPTFTCPATNVGTGFPAVITVVNPTFATAAPSGATYTGGTLTANFIGNTASNYTLVLSTGQQITGCTFTSGSTTFTCPSTVIAGTPNTLLAITTQGVWANITANGIEFNGNSVIFPGSAPNLTGTYQISSSSSGTPVVANGTITLNGGGAAGPISSTLPGSHSYVFAGNGVGWYVPTTTSIGASYYLFITQTGSSGGYNFNTPATSAYTNITSGGLTVGISGGSGAGSVSGTYVIATDPAGANQIASGTLVITGP